MSDRYTKAVLTVIAAALVAIVVQNAIGPTNAQSGRVFLCDPHDPDHCASLANLGRIEGYDRFVIITRAAPAPPR